VIKNNEVNALPVNYNSAFASSQFQRKIRELEQDLLRMGILVGNSCRLAHTALFERNLSAIDRIVKLDEEIDKFYRQIDSQSAQLMSIASPVAQDLRLLSAFIQIVRDLERIGDYAEELGEIAGQLFRYPVHECMPQIEKMSSTTRLMLEKSLTAITNVDGKAYQELDLLDDEVDKTYAHIYQTLSSQRDIQGSLEPVILLILSSRHLERMADHANNVARRIRYVVTGERN
jgi:phosphate transport system protein